MGRPKLSMIAIIIVFVIGIGLMFIGFTLNKQALPSKQNPTPTIAAVEKQVQNTTAKASEILSKTTDGVYNPEDAVIVTYENLDPQIKAHVTQQDIEMALNALQAWEDSMTKGGGQNANNPFIKQYPYPENYMIEKLSNADRSQQNAHAFTKEEITKVLDAHDIYFRYLGVSK